uniref:Uncharacterized protein n=1 Tax=Timema douglasi TaxID=61478 RepID=A0A7R8VKF0_TIMDO|nr:unnamed protein product [Timema douglasi]
MGDGERQPLLQNDTGVNYANDTGGYVPAVEFNTTSALANYATYVGDTPDRDSNPDLPVIGSLVYREWDALELAIREAGYIETEQEE